MDWVNGAYFKTKVDKYPTEISGLSLVCLAAFASESLLLLQVDLPGFLVLFYPVLLHDYAHCQDGIFCFYLANKKAAPGAALISITVRSTAIYLVQNDMR